MTNAAGRPLSGKIAVVAGATRAAGRGIACMLGEAGATVYCSGRSTRGNPATPGRPETIEETAELVTAAGGRGVAVRADHSNPDDVAQSFRICSVIHPVSVGPGSTAFTVIPSAASIPAGSIAAQASDTKAGKCAVMNAS